MAEGDLAVDLVPVVTLETEVEVMVVEADKGAVMPVEVQVVQEAHIQVGEWVDHHTVEPQEMIQVIVEVQVVQVV